MRAQENMQSLSPQHDLDFLLTQCCYYYSWYFDGLVVSLNRTMEIGVDTIHNDKYSIHDESP